MDNLQDKEEMLEKAQDAMIKSMDLIQEAKKALDDPDNADNKIALAQVIDLKYKYLTYNVYVCIYMYSV